MKTKHIVKTVGLISAFSFSTIALVSCDGSDSPSVNNGGPSVEGEEQLETIESPQSLNGKRLVFNITSSTDSEEAGDTFTVEFSETTLSVIGEDGQDEYAYTKINGTQARITYTTSLTDDRDDGDTLTAENILTFTEGSRVGTYSENQVITRLGQHVRTVTENGAFVVID